MTNEHNEAIERFRQAVQDSEMHKFVVDLHASMKLYRELLKKGWSHKDAWQFAFMGIVAYTAMLPVGPLPGPKPDPYLMMAPLYEIAKYAYSHLCKLSESFKTELAFLETLIQDQQGEVPK